MTDPDITTACIQQYGASQGLYKDLTSAIERLLTQLLQAEGLRVHSVTGRVKSVPSLMGKLSKPESSYTKLNDVTDLAAVRVTTYLASEVDKVAGVIEREFQIDREKSSDRRKTLDPDRFGYLSVHYIVTLSPDRSGLKEYSAFVGIPIEIQVRSVLQHAWAEIEHDIGYKTKEGVPTEYTRRLSRLAGLLELADDEFIAIVEGLSSYREQVNKEVAANRPVELNKDSMRALLSDSAIQRLDERVAEAMGAKIGEASDTFLELSVRILHFVGLTTTDAVKDAAKDLGEKVGAFAKVWLRGTEYKTTSRGIGALYLVYLILGRSGDVERGLAFFNDNNFGAPEDRANFAKRMVEAARGL